MEFFVFRCSREGISYIRYMHPPSHSVSPPNTFLPSCFAFWIETILSREVSVAKGSMELPATVMYLMHHLQIH